MTWQHSGGPDISLRQSFSENHGSTVSSRLRGKEWSTCRKERSVDWKGLVELWGTFGELPFSTRLEIRVWMVRSWRGGSSRRKLDLGKSAWRRGIHISPSRWLHVNEGFWERDYLIRCVFQWEYFVSTLRDEMEWWDWDKDIC